jgi:spore germination cell wall hydrolase CwlJ-like protein
MKASGAAMPKPISTCLIMAVGRGEDEASAQKMVAMTMALPSCGQASQYHAATVTSRCWRRARRWPARWRAGFGV